MTETENRTSKKRFDWIKLGFILMFIVGMGFFFYPTVSDVYGKYRDSKLIAKYSKKVSGMKEADMDRIADFINRGVLMRDDEVELRKIGEEVSEFMTAFPMPQF